MSRFTRLNPLAYRQFHHNSLKYADVFSTVKSFRDWRTSLGPEQTVGFVPTMGALHEGHLKLIENSLRDNTRTVVSIFVNPSQFAPHEDLSSYPRTFDKDRESIENLCVNNIRVDAIFAPSSSEMYPNGIKWSEQIPFTDLDGTFVQVQGMGNVLEGSSRPTFFKGVATVVTKLFNVVQPFKAYFGQKDIQQALVLRRMLSDLLVQTPTAENLIIVPTVRDRESDLALSSRNAYLSSVEREKIAPYVHQSLKEGKLIWDEYIKSCNDASTVSADNSRHASIIQDILNAGKNTYETMRKEAEKHDIHVKPLYFSINDIDTLADLYEHPELLPESRGAFISTACQVGKTRLIDNVLLEKNLK